MLNAMLLPLRPKLLTVTNTTTVHKTRTNTRFGWETPEVQTEARRRFNGHYADVDDHTILPSEYSTPVYQVLHMSRVCYCVVDSVQ
jgi:hypothetical protein